MNLGQAEHVDLDRCDQDFQNNDPCRETNERTINDASVGTRPPRVHWRQRTLRTWLRPLHPKRLCIAVDVDEVLAFFVPALCDFHNERYGTKLTATDFQSYRFAEVWGGTDSEAIHKVHEFFRTPAFQELVPVPGAKQVLQSRLDRFRFVVVTSRQLVIERETRAWLDRNFGGIFEQVYFGNQWTLNHSHTGTSGTGLQKSQPFGGQGRRRRKADICRACGAMMLIDDLPHNLQDCQQTGLFGVLFDFQGQYGWSKSSSMNSDDVTVVHSWEQVGQLLDQL
ncbi:hypothetical protein CCYA_CCYA02G0735 [Cyanidiococcus yangmingshanensis]|nr:hypothetical protein CCYA_CCYA02G0735 [Cyanidiococcus yangmingshanensis]